MSKQKIPVITIDGPSGTGKGTLSLMLSRYLGWNYLDSGALYRVLAYEADEKKFNFSDHRGLAKLARALNLRFEVDEENNTHVFLDEQEITWEIRTERCGQNASKLAAVNEVRQALLERQQDFAKEPGLVTDGRDMGTVVFPDADLKIYLNAQPEERALRRYYQLKEKGNDVSLAEVVEELKKRDERDIERAHSPLKPASDAIQIDTTRLTIVQAFDVVLQLAKKQLINPA